MLRALRTEVSRLYLPEDSQVDLLQGFRTRQTLKDAQFEQTNASNFQKAYAAESLQASELRGNEIFCFQISTKSAFWLITKNPQLSASWRASLSTTIPATASKEPCLN